MYKKILVPLDGSKLAECALPYAEEIAVCCSTEEVTLISVTELLTLRTSNPDIKEAYRSSERTDLSSGVDSEVIVSFGKKERQAERYLKRLVKALEAKGIRARSVVRIGNPAQEVVSFADQSGADLIVMSSHGRSGPSRWAYGSVADKIFRASCIPILMVRAPGCFPGI